jgi:hypothetical protein
VNARQIEEALESVRLVQSAVLDRQMFRGYSARARALSGVFALSAAAVMAGAGFPHTREAMLSGWAAVFVVAVLVNAVAVTDWFLHDAAVARDVRRLRPILDVVPPLTMGGVFTAALLLRGQHDALCGMWMCFFGLANLASRHVLPRAMGIVGLFYLAAGCALLLVPDTAFLNPWPMGIVFFAGELAGGAVLQADHTRSLGEAGDD